MLIYYNNCTNIYIHTYTYIYIYIPGEQFYITYCNGASQWLSYELKATKTTTINKDHFSTIKPGMLTRQPNQRQKGTHNLIPKELWCRRAICTHIPSLRRSLLPWGSQNLTGKIHNFAAYFCFYFISIRFLLPMPCAFAISSCHYVTHFIFLFLKPLQD
jgi:hypothetical protein